MFIKTREAANTVITLAENDVRYEADFSSGSKVLDTIHEATLEEMNKDVDIIRDFFKWLDDLKFFELYDNIRKTNITNNLKYLQD